MTAPRDAGILAMKENRIYRRATAAEDAAMSQALEELSSGDYVTHGAINWD